MGMLISANRLGWSGEDALIAPPVFASGCHSFNADTELTRPLSLMESDAIDCHIAGVTCRPAVGGLLLRCSPAAVLWAVAAIIINAVNGVVMWPFSHVLNKGPKVISPFIAHANTPAPIKMIFHIVGVVASSFHGLPCGVERVLCFVRSILWHGKDNNQFYRLVQV